MRFAVLILAICATFGLSAQEIDSVAVAPRKDIKTRLAEAAVVDSLTVVEERVLVTECGDAKTIVDKSLRSDSKSVAGYRIVIFMSNTQTARRDALLVQENFSQLFPEEQSYLTYENPYFKVAVGNCVSQEEAIVLLGRLRRSFPKAFMMRENIDIGEFTR